VALLNCEYAQAAPVVRDLREAVNVSFGTERKSQNGWVISEAGGTPAAPTADRPQPPSTSSPRP